MPTAVHYAIDRDELEELLADRSLHLGESKQLAIIRRFEERVGRAVAGELEPTDSEVRYTLSSPLGRLIATLVTFEEALERIETHNATESPETRMRARAQLRRLHAGETRHLPGGILVSCVYPPAPAEPSAPFSHSGVLLVRVKANNIGAARHLLSIAASAALESAPGIVAIESTGVSANPAPRRRREVSS